MLVIVREITKDFLVRFVLDKFGVPKVPGVPGVSGVPKVRVG